MNRLKESIQKNAFDSKLLLDKTEQEIKTRLDQQKVFNRRIWLATGVWAAMLVAIIIRLVVYNTTLPDANSFATTSPVSLASSQSQEPSSQRFAMVSVDINPSVNLYVDATGLVTEIEAVNEDAQQLDLLPLDGQAIENVLVDIILMAQNKGFIQWTDTLPDFVLISTVILDETDPSMDLDQNKLDDEIAAKLSATKWANPYLQIVLIKSDLNTKLAADKQGESLGWYILHTALPTDDPTDGSIAGLLENPENRSIMKNLEGVFWFGEDDMEEMDTDEEYQDSDEEDEFESEDRDDDHHSSEEEEIDSETSEDDHETDEESREYEADDTVKNTQTSSPTERIVLTQETNDEEYSESSDTEETSETIEESDPTTESSIEDDESVHDESDSDYTSAEMDD